MGAKARCIAVLGTGSDVGKSIVATALCRHYARQGVRVAPFKAQNMSNNSGVTPEGLEMGRAQIVGTLVYLEQPRTLDRFQAVILPGSKNTRNDLEWLTGVGWRDLIRAYHRKGGHPLGICGGYQMLGSAVVDPDGVEGRPGSTPGLNLLPVETELKAPKTTTRTRFIWEGNQGTGFEIHMGRTHRTGGKALLNVHARNGIACDERDGCISEDGRVLGSYLHGLFDAPGIIERRLQQIGLDGTPVDEIDGPGTRDRAYDALADHAGRYLDFSMVDRMMGGMTGRPVSPQRQDMSRGATSR